MDLRNLFIGTIEIVGPFSHNMQFYSISRYISKDFFKVIEFAQKAETKKLRLIFSYKNISHIMYRDILHGGTGFYGVESKLFENVDLREIQKIAQTGYKSHFIATLISNFPRILKNR